MKTRLNGIVFDPGMQPGARGRYATLDDLGGAGIPDQCNLDTTSHKILRDVENPINKFKSGQNPFTKPSMILRKKGYNPY